MNRISWKYPDVAAPFAAGLADKTERNDAIEKVADYWLQTDPVAATKWLNSTTLPEDRKQMLINSAKH